MKTYLKSLTLLILTTLLIVCAASYVIDPYGIYSHQVNLFPRKVAAADKGRTVKPYQSLSTKPFTVLVGNSRVEIGMPTEHAFYQQRPVYNMGLPGANVAMQYDYAMHVIESSGSVRQVVIALDFLDFASDIDNIKSTVDRGNWQWRLKGLTSPNLAQKRQYIAERISMLFSLSAITDTISTIVNQKRNINALNTMGFNDGRVYQFHVLSEGYGALYQQKADELDARLKKTSLVFSQKSYALSELENFILMLNKHDISIYLIINPYQKPYLDKLEQYGLNGELALWKNHMVVIAKQYGLPLYDFAILSTPVTDVVAANSRVIHDSVFFWEPAHYKRTFGSLILDTLSQKSCADLCIFTEGQK